MQIGAVFALVAVALFVIRLARHLSGELVVQFHLPQLFGPVRVLALFAVTAFAVRHKVAAEDRFVLSLEIKLFLLLSAADDRLIEDLIVYRDPMVNGVLCNAHTPDRDIQCSK